MIDFAYVTRYDSDKGYMLGEGLSTKTEHTRENFSRLKIM